MRSLQAKLIRAWKEGGLLVCQCLVTGMLRDSVKGAATSLNAAVNPELNKEEFVYYSDCQPAHTSAAAM